MKFRYAVIPVVIFYILCDFATTTYAINTGCGVESNPALAGIVGNTIMFLIMKILVIPVIYILYSTTENKPAQIIYVAIPTLAGILLSVNNLCAIYYNIFPIEIIINMI